MSEKIEDLIQSINESPIFARILEVGAGVPVANLLYSQRGASKSIYSTECYYAREAFENKFGVSKERAVSPIRLRDLIIEHDDITRDILENKYNTVLATTFQVGEKNNISTHGWIVLNISKVIEDDDGDWKGDKPKWVEDNLKYYHISIHEPLTRQEYIEKIGEIGVKILHSQNKSIPKDCYIDSVLDDMLVPIYEDCVNAIINSDEAEQMSVFHEDGRVDRIESITRGVDNLILYKGSFNPPTVAHEEIATQSLAHYDSKSKSKFLFCISVNTVQKGEVDVESLVNRIRYLHGLGYSVIVCNRGLYVDNIKFLRLVFDGNIVFPMGVDTINRISNDYYKLYCKAIFGDCEEGIEPNYFDKNKFEQDFFNSEIICFSRGGIEMNSLLDSGLVNHKEQKHKDVSSSKVRDLFDKGEDELAVEMIPKPIRHYIIKEFSKK